MGLAPADLPIERREKLARFIAHYERLTRHMISPAAIDTDVVARLDGDRRLAQHRASLGPHPPRKRGSQRVAAVVDLGFHSAARFAQDGGRLVMRIAVAGLSLALVLAFAGAAQASPPDIAAFLDRSVSAPQLSPSGRYLAYDLTEGVIDQLVITDLDGGTSNILFKTKAATKRARRQGRASEQIIGIQWKSRTWIT